MPSSMTVAAFALVVLLAVAAEAGRPLRRGREAEFSSHIENEEVVDVAIEVEGDDTEDTAALAEGDVYTAEEVASETVRVSLQLRPPAPPHPTPAPPKRSDYLLQGISSLPIDCVCPARKVLYIWRFPSHNLPTEVTVSLLWLLQTRAIAPCACVRLSE